jgi:hypothetical protein
MTSKRQVAKNKREWKTLAQPGSLPAKATSGQDLTPGERLLAVTLLGLPVSKDAA